MAKKIATNNPINPGMKMVLTFFIMLLVNSLVIMVTQSLFPENIVLGTAHISPTAAAILSMGTLSLIVTFALPFITEWEMRVGSTFSTTQWMAAYFLINFVGIWVIGRYAEILGLGISSWITAAALAIALDIIQGLVMMQVEKNT